MKQKIYIVGLYTGRNSYGVIQDAGEDGDIMGYAIVQGNNCGDVIASHYSSGLYWLEHDMGLTSNWKHEIYKEKFGDNYELVFAGTFNTEEELDKWAGLMFKKGE